jgi:hypothetical protein
MFLMYAAIYSGTHSLCNSGCYEHWVSSVTKHGGHETQAVVYLESPMTGTQSLYNPGC